MAEAEGAWAPEMETVSPPEWPKARPPVPAWQTARKRERNLEQGFAR